MVTGRVRQVVVLKRWSFAHVLIILIYLFNVFISKDYLLLPGIKGSFTKGNQYPISGGKIPGYPISC